ncbi:hypothetical protein BT96DRAFT_387955 [Gymnopus androsaceus JB14]|uniref:Uncharacterized protein n=1 Tax=Gymnopus androsaceus JB14 TaxID=1447944 RepID=A0A6A4I8B2_9AGAR|nr:hypothetical protein BT96DRAFT_387955 [Gymnopus androsaceus JB14]
MVKHHSSMSIFRLRAKTSSSLAPQNRLQHQRHHLPAPSVTAYKSRSRVRHRALITDRGSAITGSIEATLQLTHLINEIRGATKSPEKAERRKQVEALLNLLEFNGKNRPFHLTSMANTLLQPGLHFSLDQYALFCMTIPSNQMQLALDQLDRDNKDWARRAKINKNAKRQLDFSKPVNHVTTIQVVVLHPSFNRITCLY